MIIKSIIQEQGGWMRCDTWNDREKCDFSNAYLSDKIPEVAEKYGVATCTIKRWARKLDLPRKNRLRCNHEHIELTDRQVEVLKGCLLGDGCLQKVKPTTNSAFYVCHGDKQNDWIVWKREIFKPFSREIYSRWAIARKRLKSDKIVNDFTRSYLSHTLYTMRHKVFTDIEKQWYARNCDGEYVFKKVGSVFRRVKVVPDNFVLTKLALAVWFMDDGHNKVGSKRHEIYTLDFHKDEVDVLIQNLMRLGLNCHSEKYHRGGHFVVVDKLSYYDLAQIVVEELPDLPNNMLYKIKV